MPKKPTPVRIPISNVLLGDDYTGKLYVGSERKEVNLLLDTGSSTLAVDHKSYDPRHDPKAKVTELVQEVSYADGSNWIGSVVRTDMTVSERGRTIDLPDVSVAVAYHQSQMFGKSQGILGLAYQPLDDAVDVNEPTVPPRYSPNDVRAGRKVFVEPYFMQLEKAGLVANKFAFYTRRSTNPRIQASRARPAQLRLSHSRRRRRSDRSVHRTIQHRRRAER
jgi:aspartyl protease